MTHTETLPTTVPEAHRWIARRLIDLPGLLAAYAGRPAAAGSDGQIAAMGAEFSWRVERREVVYRFPDLEGTVKVRVLERLAASAATRGAVARVTAALDAWSAIHRDEDAQFGRYWVRDRELYSSPEWGAHQQRVQAALRELHAARDAWWDGQPGSQLDLFGAAS